MQIVIEIPDRQYELLQRVAKTKRGMENLSEYGELILNGTPLPKGHGQLVDVNSIPEEDKNITVKSLLHPETIAYAGSISLEEYINKLTVIIEADKAESEKK